MRKYEFVKVQGWYEFAVTYRLDLIILDVMMPEMDGYEVCRRLKRNPTMSNIPVLMVTAKGQERDRVRGLDIGADDYLPKPYAKEELEARVRALLERYTQRPGIRCFKMGHFVCPKAAEPDPQRVFVGMPFSPDFEDSFEYGIIPALEDLGLKPWKADQEISNIDIMCKLCEALQNSKYAVMNISDWNPNVLFELGLAYGLGKTTVIIKHYKSNVPTDLKGIEYIEYKTAGELREKLVRFFSKET